ncbi:thioesterase II family protein [Burkholderia sp. L27(2015)]|uniref:thioesterase II family protein n=1 Tax=Burkholderia sp. L27(2015) TaxID=1641858 RepID=UPI00131ACAF3|nr:alpha/beta fold hydrolase [Burkholderia sp. L27(2015)]
MNSTPWLVRSDCPAPRLRLYCFSYAGGSAADFMPWQSALAPDIEVCAIQLPGRGARLDEPTVASMAQLLETLAPVIARDGEQPFAFFGHSLGALVAFEVARYAMHRSLPQPSRLLVSGCAAPQRYHSLEQLHRLSDDGLVDALRRLNGTPAELLEHRELMELILPALRADLTLAETYAYRPGPSLPVPITVLSGTLDLHTQLEPVDAWHEQTCVECRTYAFEGDHFFIKAHFHAVIACIHAELTGALAASSAVKR